MLRITAGQKRLVPWREIWQSRDLVFLLSARELRLRYRQTVIGASWIVLQPLLLSALLAAVLARAGKLPSNGVPYFPFAYSGMIAWSMVSSTITRASGVLLSNASLVSKVYFPRLILPLSVAFPVVVDLFASLAAIVVILWVTGQGVQISAAASLLWALAILILAVGVGLVTAGLSARYRDIPLLIPFILQAWFFASPILYPASAVPADLQTVYRLNPAVALIEGFRSSLVASSPPPLDDLFISLSMTVAIFMVGVAVFARLEKKFADVI